MLAYWRDVLSDLSVFHRIRDPLAEPGLDGPLFLAFAHRLDVYGGAVALRVAQHRAAVVAPLPQPARVMDFDEYFAGRRTQLIEAAARMGGGESGG